MPCAIALPLRQQLVQRAQQGQSLRQIAADLGLAYRTVRGLWRRYRERGDAGLTPDYARCGRAGVRFAPALQDAALTYKREHPRWGAPLIRHLLTQDFPQQPVPGVRTLQTWFRQAGLATPRARTPTAPRERGRVAHAVWQLDAKEEIPLANGQRVVVFAVSDEATGAVLSAATFPPAQRSADAGVPGAGLAGADLCPVGAAGAAAGG